MEDTECAICFEDIDQVASLPCSCKIAYCLKCWDKALARSFISCDQARCPTCRGRVRVDFDSETGRLLFSSPEAGAQQELAPESVKRILRQARPAQIRLLLELRELRPILREYAKTPECFLHRLTDSVLLNQLASIGGDVAGCADTAEIVQRLLSASSDRPGALPSFLASVCGEGDAAPCQPKCVCGSTLERVCSRERMNRIFDKLVPESATDEATRRQIYDNFMARGVGGVECDLCESIMVSDSAVWTCMSDDSTIFHATSYDVCEECFACHACGGEVKRDTHAQASTQHLELTTEHVGN
eukprot:TRINITY_DN74629_c0_g1_i1.p1 TRINITY_DN74629_c0_g1~~TRINITY_DN74629_c0_g1_i1.p1  ORF type:complete len:329 (-),score=49.05 TRINITY_DN74629_c0_g1_i1:33-935(-)